MLKKTIMLTVILFSVQSEASLRCTWLETKAGAASEAMLMADQASKETFCKIGNQFVKYANDYIRECSGKSNLGIQGSAGIMLNNISIVEQKCQGYNRTISDDAKEWWNKSKNKSSNEGQHEEAETEQEELQRLRQEKADREKAEMQAELTRLRAEKMARETQNSVQKTTNPALTHSQNNSSSRQHNYTYVCYDSKYITSGKAIYNGCVRESSKCQNMSKHHFGKYPNDKKAHAAFIRCISSNPKFVDTQGL